MFSVYKITNTINNKCYIGSSIHPAKRWRQHINLAQNPNSSGYNYPLYKAFRKYGIEQFTFEILRDDFESVIDALLKHADLTMEALPAFVAKLNQITADCSIEFYVSLSADKADVEGIADVNIIE